MLIRVWKELCVFSATRAQCMQHTHTVVASTTHFYACLCVHICGSHLIVTHRNHMMVLWEHVSVNVNRRPREWGDWVYNSNNNNNTRAEHSRAKHQRNCTKISRVSNFFSFITYYIDPFSFIIIILSSSSSNSRTLFVPFISSLTRLCPSFVCVHLFSLCVPAQRVCLFVLCAAGRCRLVPLCTSLLCFGLHMYACVCASVCVALHFLRCCLPANAHLAWCTPDCYYSILSLLFTYVYILACFASCVSVCVCIILVFLLRRFSCMETLIKWMRIFVFCVAACRRHVRCQYFVFYFFFRYVSIFLSLYRCVFAFHFIIIAVELQWIGKR